MYNKYNAERTNGFSSKLESAVYDILRLREKAREIEIIRCQPRVEMRNKAGRKWVCIPDFLVLDLKTGKDLFIEAKGMTTDRFLATKWIWEECGPNPMEIWKGRYQKPYLDELLIPVNNDAKLSHSA